MKIYMVASESHPFIKTGGLAEVVYSLSRELQTEGNEVSIFIPYYKTIKDNPDVKPQKIKNYLVRLGWRQSSCDVYLQEVEGIRFFLIDGKYFSRDNCYGYDDDGERFAFFTLAVKELFYQLLDIPDIVHCHDWHTGMLPCLIREDEYAKKHFAKTKFVFSIHNPAFQGLLEPSAVGDLYGLPYVLYDNGAVRLKNSVSTLKTGIMYADKITTVSPNHRNELLTSEGGMGLDGVLRLREYDFVGILNGIDFKEYNPHSDQYISQPYSAVNFFQKKNENKLALLQKLKIFSYGKPLFVFVSRLVWQKGLDIAFPALEEMAKLGCNVIILGSGELRYQLWAEDLRNRYPKNIAVYIGYKDSLAHEIYAAADFFLIPSLFEPCGIGQMIAQRYGTLPIVRRTGGLKDSVILYDGANEDEANGFGFDWYSQDEINRTCYFAYNTWNRIDVRKKLIKNAMKTDNSWKKSAQKYLEIYNTLINKK